VGRVYAELANGSCLWTPKNRGKEDCRTRGVIVSLGTFSISFSRSTAFSLQTVNLLVDAHGVARRHGVAT
jgi:hypothetical protein